MTLVSQASSRSPLAPRWVRVLAILIPVTFVAVASGMLVTWGAQAVRQFHPFAVLLGIACIGTLRNSRAWAYIAGYTAVAVGLAAVWRVIQRGSQDHAVMLLPAAVYLAFGLGLLYALRVSAPRADA